MKIAVCWKWVSLDREREADRRWSGVSAADEAALEVALRIADRADTAPDAAPSEVTVICLGPPSADDVLREAIAAGATSAVRVDASTELESHVVAVALAEHLGDRDLVVCGDYSLDRGTGSVPAFLAGELSMAQALGLLEVDVDRDDTNSSALRVIRRLDGGRREILDVTPPAVLSVEGSAASLRRASLAASLAARTAPVATVRGPHGRLPEAEIHPYRPRARVLPAPTGGSLDRVRQILDVGGGDTHAELVTLDAPAAASKILDQLRSWGYLDAPASGRPGAG
ncbi:MAG TPA: mycofactocin-associated electron transfer flavoprotein beta subunit [Ilumatobacteraceae bacterium]|nr:mycofactocin-associated electron transfer flavoprotein beta subunit [Ilumatobacteraceae bacterium]